MSRHIFECSNSSHAIWDISDEPVPHIGGKDQIWCPTCEQDVTGIYRGQASGVVDSGDPITSIEFIPASVGTDADAGDSPYCMHCDGVCTDQ